MDREAQIREAVADEDVVAAGVDEDAVAPEPDRVVANLGAGRVPQIDAVAARVHPLVVAAGDRVVRHHGVAGAVDVDAVEVGDQDVVANPRVPRLLGELDAGVDGLVRRAGAAHGQPGDRAVGRIDGQHAAGAAAIDHRSVAPGDHQGPVDGDRPPVGTGAEPKRVSRLGRGDGLGKRPRSRRHDHFGRRGRSPRNEGDEDEETRAHDQALAGSTNMRPRISMCSAWQNHWQ